jgi:hypothetical protein
MEYGMSKGEVTVLELDRMSDPDRLLVFLRALADAEQQARAFPCTMAAESGLAKDWLT